MSKNSKNNLRVLKKLGTNFKIISDPTRNTGFVPYTINERSYKPCICANEQPSWRDNGLNRRSFLAQGRRMTKVDDKLEYPFSNAEKRKRK